MLSSLYVAFGMPGPMEMIIIGIIALLLFGRRLPEVMRNLGKGIVEFKRGVRGIEDQVDQSASLPSENYSRNYSQPSTEPTGATGTAGQASVSEGGASGDANKA